ncbi:MAG: helix-turn-helix transcriptional regulator [Bacteroidota bacterium]|nr:helix-turn-helix transcriptional regulator [Bacteroidota bacterium]
MKDKIFNIDLKYDNTAVPFAIKTMEEIDVTLGGIADVPHRHNYYTVIWSYGATGKHIIDFKEYAIEPDHLFFVSPRQVHQVITNPSPTGIVVLFTPEFLQKNSIREDFISNLRIFRDSDETPPLPVNETMKANLLVFANAMMSAFHSDSDMRFETIGAYLKLFLIECSGHCSLYPGSNTQNLEVGRALVRNFKDLVEVHFREWHQVKEYADALNVSPNYLNEVIKSAIGKSAKDYIQNRLILETKRMTIFTDKSIKEIGFDLGFDDPSHFSKFFKTYTGQSMVEFKESVIR